jgi:hypothetical protein
MEKVLCAIELITVGLEALDGIVDEKIKIGYIENIFKKLEHTAIIPPRRARSCVRGVRQPVSKWSRINTR